MRRIGIDVGGTNTDAVLMEDERVLAWVKTPTTTDVTGGVRESLRLLVEEELGGVSGRVDGVMIGTTHFTNAVVQRRDLQEVAAIRIGLPSGRSLPPFVDWPKDLAVAAGVAEIGDASRVAGLDAAAVAWAIARFREMVEESVDRMKADARPLPLLAVGGGAFLVLERVPGISEVLHVSHASVANAVGAAIAQVSGEVDQVFSGVSRDEAVSRAEALARERAVEAGADPRRVDVVDVEDLPLAYLPGDARRVRVVGEAGPTHEAPAR